MPAAERARSDRCGRGRLRRAQPRHNGSIGRAVRALRRAHRHEDLLDVAATQPRRPARAHADDADQSQREAEAVLARRRDTRAVRGSVRGGGRRARRSEARLGARQVRTTVRQGARCAGRGRRTRSRCRRRKRRRRATTASIGAVGDLLGGFLGGKEQRADSMSRSMSRSQGRASTARKRLESASNRAEEKQDALANLEQEFEADLAAVHAEAEAVAAAIDTHAGAAREDRREGRRHRPRVGAAPELLEPAAQGPPVPWRLPMLSLLRRNRDFRTVFTAQVISYMGDWFATVAVLGLVLDLTDSSFARGDGLRCAEPSRVLRDAARRHGRRPVRPAQGARDRVVGASRSPRSGSCSSAPVECGWPSSRRAMISLLGAFFAPASQCCAAEPRRQERPAARDGADGVDMGSDARDRRRARRGRSRCCSDATPRSSPTR